MTRRHTYTTEVEFGGDTPTACFEVTLSYTVAWGSPETGRGYMADPALYDPGSADVVEDLKVDAIDGKARPWIFAMGTDAEHEASILNHIGESLDEELISAAWAEVVDDKINAAEARLMPPERNETMADPTIDDLAAWHRERLDNCHTIAAKKARK